jgi:phosphohistidine phosphatase
LAREDLEPDLILTSSAVRASATAREVCRSMGRSDAAVQSDDRLYLASLSMLFEVLRLVGPDRQRVMVVGHNPGLAELVEALADAAVEYPDDGKLLPTGALARFQLAKPWSDLASGTGRLLSLTRPRELPRRFPFVTAQGVEQRSRPGYYFRQVGVIPYRVAGNGKPQVLLIAKHGKEKWAIPTGFHDLELSAEESACRRAREMAGVSGEVDEVPLGVYELHKWGGICTVEVFGMQVKDTLDDWDERRRRAWLAPKRAAKLLDRCEVVPLLHELVGRLGSAPDQDAAAPSVALQADRQPAAEPQA